METSDMFTAQVLHSASPIRLTPEQKPHLRIHISALLSAIQSGSGSGASEVGTGS